MPMKLKTVQVNGKTYAEVGEKGNPVYEEDGSVFEFDAQSAKDRIHSVNEEAKNHRLKAKDLEEKLNKFEGVDPEQAKKDRATVKDIDLSKIKTPEEIEKVKKALSESYEEKIKATNLTWEGKINKLTEQTKNQEASIRKLLVGNAFASSTFIQENLNIPSDIVETFFGKNFKVEGEGEALKVVGYKSTGEKIYSRTSPGTEASFEEALSILLNEYPNKEKIMVGGTGGSGSAGNKDTGKKGSKISGQEILKLSLSEFEKQDKAGNIAV